LGEITDNLLNMCLDFLNLDKLLNIDIIENQSKRKLLFLIVQIIKMFLQIFIKRIIPNFKILSLSLLYLHSHLKKDILKSNMIENFKKIILLIVNGTRPFLSIFVNEIFEKLEQNNGRNFKEMKFKTIQLEIEGISILLLK